MLICKRNKIKLEKLLWLRRERGKGGGGGVKSGVIWIFIQIANAIKLFFREKEKRVRAELSVRRIRGLGVGWVIDYACKSQPLATPRNTANCKAIHAKYPTVVNVYFVYGLNSTFKLKWTCLSAFPYSNIENGRARGGKKEF